MFRFGFCDAFGVGAAASLIAITLAFVAGIVFLQTPPEGTGASFLLLALPIAIVMPLVAGASISIWRNAFLALMRGRRPKGTIRTAFALAGGLVLGGPTFYGAIVLQAALGGQGHEYAGQIAVPWLLALVGALGLVAVLIVVLASALALFLKWLEAGTTSLLSVALCKPSPRPLFTIGILVSCLLAFGWFSLGYIVLGSAWYVQHEAGRFSALSTFRFGLIASTFFPLNVIAWTGLVALWAFPLGARWRERRSGTLAHTKWPFLDSVPRAVIRAEPPLYLRRALLIGVAGGLAAAVALPWLRLLLPLGALNDVRYPETAGAEVLLSMTLTCIAVQAVIAALVALAIPKLPTPHAMFAAFVSGWILAVAEVLQLVVRGASVSMGLDLVLLPVVFGGALPALVAALTMSTLRLPTYALFTRLRSARELSITEQPACPQKADQHLERRLVI
jgi:hypothetical protein